MQTLRRRCRGQHDSEPTNTAATKRCGSAGSGMNDPKLWIDPCRFEIKCGRWEAAAVASLPGHVPEDEGHLSPF
jgi:hypothetical protein